MTTFCPAISSVPLRPAPLFAAIENATTPLPDPDAPPFTARKESTTAAVQVHPAGALTTTVPLDAATVKLLLDGVRK